MPESDWGKQLSAEVRAVLKQGVRFQKNMMAALKGVEAQAGTFIKRLDGIDTKLTKLDAIDGKLDDMLGVLRQIRDELRKNAG